MTKNNLKIIQILFQRILSQIKLLKTTKEKLIDCISISVSFFQLPYKLMILVSQKLRTFKWKKL